MFQRKAINNTHVVHFKWSRVANQRTAIRLQPNVGQACQHRYKRQDASNIRPLRWVRSCVTSRVSRAAKILLLSTMLILVELNSQAEHIRVMACGAWSQTRETRSVVRASEAWGARMSSETDGEMLSQSMLRRCLNKVKKIAEYNKMEILCNYMEQQLRLMHEQPGACSSRLHRVRGRSAHFGSYVHSISLHFSKKRLKLVDLTY
jgi:hypothetical protein